MPWDVIVNAFGGLGAIAVVIVLWWKYIKPKLDAADAERSGRIAELQAQVTQLTDQREQAKDAVIAAFGDIGDSFENFADDVRALVEDSVNHHERSARKRHDLLLQQLTDHKNEIIEKLSQRAKDLESND